MKPRSVWAGLLLFGVLGVLLSGCSDQLPPETGHDLAGRIERLYFAGDPDRADREISLAQRAARGA